MRRFLAVLAFLLAFAACGSTEPETPLLTGRWLAVYADSGSQLTLLLTEAPGGQVSGTAALRYPEGVGFSVLQGGASGTHTHPAVTLTVLFPGSLGGRIGVVGQMEGADRIVPTNGTGPTFNRQP